MFSKGTMIDLIDIVKPYEIYEVNNIPKSLAFYKNILKLISKKGCIEFSSKNIYPVRWSANKESFVIDFRTKKERDVQGLCINTLSCYYSTETTDYFNMKRLLEDVNKNSSENLWDLINLKKNENRFLCFAKNSEDAFVFLGLYIFNQTNGRSGKFCAKGKKSTLVDHSEETIKKICKTIDSDNIIIPRRYKIDFYQNHYERFKSRLLNYKISHTKEKEILDIVLYDQVSTCFKKDYSFSLCKDLVVNKKINNKNKDVENILPFIVHKLFLEFLKEIIPINLGILAYDNYLQKNILIKEFEQIQYKKEKNPIEYDNVFILPGVF